MFLIGSGFFQDRCWQRKAFGSIFKKHIWPFPFTLYAEYIMIPNYKKIRSHFKKNAVGPE